MAATCAAFNLRRAARKATQAFDQALKPTGLKITQFSLLVAAHLESNQSLGRLAALMGMDRTTLSRNLRILAKRGLLTLEEGRDRREVRVSLTPAGVEAMERASGHWAEAQRRVEEGLGRERWGLLLKELRALGKVL
jgi:DNA-binding MarR family transcriptional regulator